MIRNLLFKPVHSRIDVVGIAFLYRAVAGRSLSALIVAIVLLIVSSIFNMD